MTERKFRHLRIQELEALVAESWDNGDVLREVADELTFRHTRRAGRLQSTVENRITPVDDLPRVSRTGSEISRTQEHSLLVGKHAGRGYPWNQGYIYFFQAIGEDLFKIGRTSKSPQSRRKGLTGCPYELELVGILASVDTHPAERSVHRYLKPYRVSSRKEWFRAPREVIADAINKFQAMYDVAFGKRDYRIIEGKYLVLECKIARD